MMKGDNSEDMKQMVAVKRLQHYAEQGKHIFNRRDLDLIFHEDNLACLNHSIRRLVSSGALFRAYQNIYIYNLQLGFDNEEALREIAAMLHPEDYHAKVIYYEDKQKRIKPVMHLETTGKSFMHITEIGTIYLTHSEKQIDYFLKRNKE